MPTFLTSDGESSTVIGAEHFHYLRVKTHLNTTGKTNNLNGYGISTIASWRFQGREENEKYLKPPGT